MDGWIYTAKYNLDLANSPAARSLAVLVKSLVHKWLTGSIRISRPPIMSGIHW